MNLRGVVAPLVMQRGEREAIRIRTWSRESSDGAHEEDDVDDEPLLTSRRRASRSTSPVLRPPRSKLGTRKAVARRTSQPGVSAPFLSGPLPAC